MKNQINVDAVESKQIVITVGKLWIMLGTLSTVIILVGGFVWNNVIDKIDKVDKSVAKSEENRVEWVKDEFKPHVLKFDGHVTDFVDLKYDVGVVVGRTNSMAERTNSTGSHNIEATTPPD